MNVFEEFRIPCFAASSINLLWKTAMAQAYTGKRLVNSHLVVVG